MCAHIEVRMISLDINKRINIGHEMSPGAISVNQLLNARSLINLFIFGYGKIRCPADWLIRNTKCGKDFVIEIICAKKIFVDTAQEITRLCTLNNAVIVSTCQCYHLAYCKTSKSFRTCSLELCWVIHRSHTENQSLSLH